MKKNKKGFTLVEILAVISVLAIISVLSIIIINKRITESKELIYEKQVDVIKESTGNWVNDNMEFVEKENKCNYIKINLNTLINEGYLSNKIENPKTGKPFDKDLVVIIQKINKTYEYIFEMDDEYNESKYTCKFDGYPNLSYSLVEGYHLGNNKEICALASDDYSGFEKLEIELYKDGLIYKKENTNREKYCMTFRSDSLYKLYGKVTSRNGNEQVNNPEDERGYYYQNYKLIESFNITGSTPSGQLTNKDVKLDAEDDIKKNLANTVKYQWQYFNGSSWIDIEGATSSSYTEKNTKINIKYRLKLSEKYADGKIENVYSNQYTLYIDKIKPSKVAVNLNGYTSNTWTNKTVTQTFTSIDNESGINRYEYSSDNRTWGPIGSTNSEAGNVVITRYVRAIDNAGNIGDSSNQYIMKIDKISPKCSTTGGSTSWTNGSRTLTGTCSDNGGSGCSSNSTKEYSKEIDTTAANPGGVSDNAGNTASCPDTTVKIDKTAPTCKTKGGSTSWTNGSRTLTGTCSDNGGSGCSSNSTKEYSKEIDTTAANPGGVSDNAGNTASCPDTTVKIDKTAPTILLSRNPSSGCVTSPSHIYITKNTSDSGSGINRVEWTYNPNGSWETESITSPGDYSAVRNQNTYYRTFDNAGNVSSVASVNICINAKPSYPASTCNIRGDTVYTADYWWTCTENHSQKKYYQRYCTDSNGNIRLATRSEGTKVCSLHPFGPGQGWTVVSDAEVGLK